MGINATIMQRMGHISKALSPRTYTHVPMLQLLLIMLTTRLISGYEHCQKNVNSFTFLHDQGFRSKNDWQHGGVCLWEES